MTVAPGFASAEPISQNWVQEKLHEVKEGTALPAGITFKQHVTLRSFFLSWRFHSLLEHTDDGELRVETFSAPSFMPDTLPADLVNLGSSLALFDVEAIAYDPGQNILHVAGPRPDYRGSGAKSGDFWIDVERGIVRKAEVVYNWGTLNVEQEYSTRDDFFVLSKQTARMRLYGATLEVRYSDYTFP